jgi:tetratricopeptide (TPR) repeat protein
VVALLLATAIGLVRLSRGPTIGWRGADPPRPNNTLNEADEVSEQIETLWKSGEIHQAIELANALTRNSALVPTGHAWLARIYHSPHRLDDASEDPERRADLAVIHAERLRALDPSLRSFHGDRVAFWDGYADDLLAQGRIAEAHRILLDAIEFESVSQPDPDPRLLDRLGMADWLAGRPREAESWWRRSLAIDPNRPQPWSQLGFLALWNGHADAAIEPLRRAVALDPNALRPLQSLATAYRMLGQLNDAQNAQERASRLRLEKEATGPPRGMGAP